jgi:hypothetical protein
MAVMNSVMLLLCVVLVGLIHEGENEVSGRDGSITLARSPSSRGRIRLAVYCVAVCATLFSF